MVYNDLQKEFLLTFRHILYKGVEASGTLSRFVSLNRFLNSDNDDLLGVSNFCCCLWIFFIAWNRPPRKPNPYLKQKLNFGHNVKTMKLYCTTQQFLLANKVRVLPNHQCCSSCCNTRRQANTRFCQRFNLLFFKTMNSCHLHNMKEKQREHIQFERYSLTPGEVQQKGFLIFTSTYETNNVQVCLKLGGDWESVRCCSHHHHSVYSKCRMLIQ